MRVPTPSVSPPSTFKLQHKIIKDAIQDFLQTSGLTIGTAIKGNVVPAWQIQVNHPKCAGCQLWF